MEYRENLCIPTGWGKAPFVVALSLIDVENGVHSGW